MNEFKAIKKYFLPLTNGNEAANYLQDDVATIFLNNKKLVVSKDLMAEDVHFRKDDGAYNIACKLLKANLSDISSSGAKPKYYMLGFSQPNNYDKTFIKNFCRGLKDVSDQFGISLIGGDTIKTKEKLCFSITIFGEVIFNKYLKRNSAKDEDIIFVSGDIGDAFLGLQILEQKIICPNTNYKKYLINRHLQPSPKIDLGMALVQNNFSKAAIDVSDGFLADLLHLCDSSGLDAVIHQELVPISVEAKYLIKNQNLDSAKLLSGGEDYELIFTANKKYHEQIMQLAQKLKIKITCVGKMQNTKRKPKIKLLDCNNLPIKITEYGYVH
jgi:thiamine-monophosphate kinase